MDVRSMFWDPVQTAFTTMWQQIGLAIPRLVSALIIFLVGLAVAKAVESLIVRALRTVRLDTLAERLKVSDVLMRGGISLTTSELFGALAYWFVFFCFFIGASNALHLDIVAQLLQVVVSFLPRVLAACILLVIAIFASSLLSTIVRTGVTNAGWQHANFLAQLVQVIILLFAGVSVLEQLQFHVVLIHQTIIIFVAALGLGFALALGLGAKDIVGKMVGDLVDRMRPTGRRR